MCAGVQVCRCAQPPSAANRHYRNKVILTINTVPVHRCRSMRNLLPVVPLTTARLRSKTIDLGLWQMRKRSRRHIAPLALHVIMYEQRKVLSISPAFFCDKFTPSSEFATMPFLLFSNTSFEIMDQVLEPTHVLRVFFLAAASTVHFLL